MITEEQICVVCKTPFTAKARTKRDLRTTCCHKCAEKLSKQSKKITREATKINGRSLKEIIEETIKENNLKSLRANTIVSLTPELKKIDSKGLRTKIGSILANDVGYKKVSKKVYQKL